MLRECRKLVRGKFLALVLIGLQCAGAVYAINGNRLCALRASHSPACVTQGDVYLRLSCHDPCTCLTVWEQTVSPQYCDWEAQPGYFYCIEYSFTYSVPRQTDHYLYCFGQCIYFYSEPYPNGAIDYDKVTLSGSGCPDPGT